ncbi:type II toxin-antitoxin system Phd/YefM family antitoxin [Sphingomonas sp. M1-B02]|uniref:type II toxin-antitoxin system Phd/YefM family antitoxin n=1 Tax=Sphingomonas sp. M1-B02 TaxID=3114300 RepID=UPI00223F9090|nr:type II toxin-antitoxin system prevent-host-death family antitoxin [Sphingomonas sp. S6-11]UZK67145.1 type II toxin-antitoxin system prevent-host-death family antitoxin [Sphingomonas sp. S6-11]
MTIQVPLEDFQRRFAELADAAERGESVIVWTSGRPPLRVVPVESRTVPGPDTRSHEQRVADAKKRASAIGMFRKEMEGWDGVVPPSMTDAEVEERWRRKFGPAD